MPFVGRPHTRFAPLLTTLLAVAAAGCGDDPVSPGSPEASSGQPQAAVTAAALGSWTIRASYPVDVVNASSASITDPGTLRTTVYVIGGTPKLASVAGITTAVRAYDAAANTWRRVASLPVPIETANEAVELGGKIYLSGGFTRRYDAQRSRWVRESLRSLYVYDPAQDKWTRRQDMPEYTAAGVSAVYGGKLYVAAGSQLWRYDPATDHWVELATVPRDVFQGGGGFIGGKLYLVSWSNAQVDVYDAATNSWSTGPALPTKWGCQPAATTLQAKLYVIGCYDTASDSYVSLVLDPKTGGWARVASPPSVPNEGWMFTLSRVFVNGQPRLELVGGTRPGNNRQFVP